MKASYFRRIIRRVVKRRSKPISQHYKKHREQARAIIHTRLDYWALVCGVAHKRVAIRNQKSRWGSCTSAGNLNFSYRLIFLPKEICDYIIVHELCHLKELNHSPKFWLEVAQILPEYETPIKALRMIEKNLRKTSDLEALKGSYFRENNLADVSNQ